MTTPPPRVNPGMSKSWFRNFSLVHLRLFKKNRSHDSWATVGPTTPVPTAQQDQSRLQLAEGYQLIRRIGSGSFAEVFLAKAPGGVDVAIKYILQPIDRPEAKRELQSLELTRQLRHPYLLQTQAYWLKDERVYVVMELADGSLRERLKHCKEAGLNSIPLGELMTYFREAAEALDFLHQNPVQRVVHREIG